MTIRHMAQSRKHGEHPSEQEGSGSFMRVIRRSNLFLIRSYDG